MPAEPDLDDIWRRIHAGRTVEGWAGHEYQDEDVLTRFSPHTIWMRGAYSSEWMELRPVGGQRPLTP